MTLMEIFDDSFLEFELNFFKTVLYGHAKRKRVKKRNSSSGKVNIIVYFTRKKQNSEETGFWILFIIQFNMVLSNSTLNSTFIVSNYEP